ncbi:MAG: hypothetical protein QMD76_07570 [Anaerosomatales bacterium]|nr:hypothetical protein [Coriobacteriia bacterium]MDI6693145.1 hypothetical protein [Anaerosomatales bacterium]GAV31679.1 hypothetical protein emb_1c0379 [Coriobacteriaceae bacterium EMTCatB1]
MEVRIAMTACKDGTMQAVFAADHDRPLKLHLGCGERYLDGYVNVDFPPSAHSVQQSSPADAFMDIRELRLPSHSVAEVRSHHLYEHFARPVACGLLSCWVSWLVEGGRIRIETPDFTRSALRAISPFSSEREKCVALRHIFGSNEAQWAVHLDGWGPKRLTRLMRLYGLTVVECKRTSWKGTYNVDVVAELRDTPPNRNQLRERVHDYLRQFTVDGSIGEQRLLREWIRQYDAQVELGWAG